MRVATKKRIKWAAGLIAILGIPAVVVAVGDSTLTVYNWGSFGYNSGGSNTPSVAVGSGNTWHYSASGTLTVGTSLIAHDSNSLVVGTWNEDTSDDEAFVVGIGTYNDQTNALEVFADGRIRIPNGQNGIALGEFGTE